MAKDFNQFKNVKAFGVFGLSPIMLIILAAILWLIGGVLWVLLFVINFITILIGDFVFVIIEWPFNAIDWLLGWIGVFIVGYFTLDHWFNWYNNVYLLLGLLVLGFVMDIFSPIIHKIGSNKQSPIIKFRNQTGNPSSQNLFLKRVGVNLELSALLDPLIVQADVDDDIADGLRNAMLRYQKLLSSGKSGLSHPSMEQFMVNYEKYYTLFSDVEVTESEQVLMSDKTKSQNSNDPLELRTDTNVPKYSDLMRQEVQKMNKYLDRCGVK